MTNLDTIQSSQSVVESVRLLLQGKALDEPQAKQFFEEVVRGEVNDIHLAAAISAIKVRTQTVGELSGAALALLESATPFPRPEHDFCDIVVLVATGTTQ